MWKVQMGLGTGVAEGLRGAEHVDERLLHTTADSPAYGARKAEERVMKKEKTSRQHPVEGGSLRASDRESRT